MISGPVTMAHRASGYSLFHDATSRWVGSLLWYLVHLKGGWYRPAVWLRRRGTTDTLKRRYILRTGAGTASQSLLNPIFPPFGAADLGRRIGLSGPQKIAPQFTSGWLMAPTDPDGEGQGSPPLPVNWDGQRPSRGEP